jgi:hypothetical protein
MSSVYKLLGTELSISSANTVSTAKVVRVVNVTNAITVLTVAYSNGTSYGNTTIAPNETLIVEKSPTDTVAGSNLRASSIAYRN